MSSFVLTLSTDEGYLIVSTNITFHKEVYYVDGIKVMSVFIDHNISSLS